MSVFQEPIRRAMLGLEPDDFMAITSMRIADIEEGEPLLLEVKSDRKRSFVAQWQAQISRWEDGAFRYVCGSSDRAKYNPDSDYSSVVSLEYWIGTPCPGLTPGRYRIDSAWTVQPHGPVITHQSDTFTIRPKEMSRAPCAHCNSGYACALCRAGAFLLSRSG